MTTGASRENLVSLPLTGVCKGWALWSAEGKKAGQEGYAGMKVRMGLTHVDGVDAEAGRSYGRA